MFFILEWHSTCFGRSFRPSSGVQDCTYSNWHLSNRYCCLLANRQQYLFDKRLLPYVESWTPDDGRKDRPKHVECHSKIKYIWYIGESSWFYCRNNKFFSMLRAWQEPSFSHSSCFWLLHHHCRWVMAFFSPKRSSCNSKQTKHCLIMKTAITPFLHTSY